MDANRQTAVDAQNARKQTAFSVERVTDFLHGKEAWDLRQRVLRIVLNDPVFDKTKLPFLSRSQRYHRGLALTKRLGELKDIHKWSDTESAIALSLVEYSLPITLHAIAFQPVFLSQGSPEQVATLGALVSNRGILGSYAQTELGHGTNVQKLETTATYIPETQEFEIHSPTLTSTKWWIGGMGKSATHSVVQAQLILPGGKNAGPHLFLVQLRSMDDHRILKGITLGDIGPKAFGAFSSLDNGYARFDHVRIPRTNMLSKFASVTPEGKYVTPPHAKLSYGGMIYIRSTMISQAGWSLGKGVTVAIRYATVRRQGNPDKTTGLERQVITYPSVHYRLFPLLAKAYVFIILGRSMTNLYQSMSSRLSSGDTSLLAETHAISSGLKVLASTQNVEGLEIARRSMGGHGFSAAAGVGTMLAESTPSATYEGDNYVLDQQVVGSSLRSLKGFMTSRDVNRLSPSSFFLRHLSATQSTGGAATIPEPRWDGDVNPLVELLEKRAAMMVVSYAESKAKGKTISAGTDARVSKAVTEAFVAARVADAFNELSQTFGSSGEKETAVVSLLLRLWLLTTIEAALADILSFFTLKSHSSTPSLDRTAGLRESITTLCLNILPHAIGLTDAFGFTDYELDSALGVKDGKVYEALMKSTEHEPLNEREVVEGYQEFIKPILERGRKLAEKQKAKL